MIELGRGFLAISKGLHRSVYISDGYLGLSGAAELYVNEVARTIAPVRMTGNWGSELMRGVRAFKCVLPKGDFVSPGLAAQMGRAIERSRQQVTHPLSAALFHQMPLQGYGRNAIERSQLLMAHPFLADDVVTWVYRSSAAMRQSDNATLAVLGRRPGLLSIPTDRGTLGASPSRMRRLSRRALIKAEYLTSHGAPSWVARVASHLPPTLMETRFLGVDKFQHFRVWMRHELAPFVRETLSGSGVGGLGDWLNMPNVRRIVDDHISGRANYTDEVDKLLTLVTVTRTLLQPPSRVH